MVARPIRGLLFDKDGTLFDFALSWSGVLDDTLAALTGDRVLQQRMAAATGYDKAAGRFEPGSPAVAGALDEVAAMWAEFLPQHRAIDILQIADRIATEAVNGGSLVPAVEDLSAYLAGLVAQGYVLGIATHDSEGAARAHLEGFNALAHFTFVAGYDSGHGLKPGPGMLLAFAKATGLAPAEIAMIGDSIHDLGVAPAAGAAMAVGVLTGPAEHKDLAPYADHVLPSIADLPDLLTRVHAAA
ncbi:MAG: HAD-IA family hydrolase [Pseudomonadota bacterium]